MCRRRCKNRASINSQPQQLPAFQNVGFDILNITEPGSLKRCADQRSCMRPEVEYPLWIDADQLYRKHVAEMLAVAVGAPTLVQLSVNPSASNVATTNV